MDEGNKWTRPNRLAEISEILLMQSVIGEPLAPPVSSLRAIGGGCEKLSKGDKIWSCMIEVTTGLDRVDRHFLHFPTREKAIEFMSANPVGKAFGEKQREAIRFRNACSINPEVSPLSLVSAYCRKASGQEVDYVCLEALCAAGAKVYPGFKTSQKVFDWLGSEDAEWMEREFGENWNCLAELEYCRHHFPESSLACLAAQLFVSFYLTEDWTSVGYLVKEIEVINGGTEDKAQAISKTRTKSGLGGGKKSKMRKMANVELLMQEIEALAEIVGHISEERVIEQAIENAQQRSTAMAKSKSTLEGYAVILRSEEPFKSRYEAVFHKNT